MNDGEENKNSLRRILEEKYGELKDRDIESDLSEESPTYKSLYKMVGSTISSLMAYDIIGCIRDSFDGEGFGLPGTTIFDINRHMDNKEIWKIIEEHNETIHYLNDSKERFYFDDNNISVMLKLMI